MLIPLPIRESARLLNRFSLHYKINYDKLSPNSFWYIENGFLAYKHLCFMAGRLLKGGQPKRL